MKIAIVGCGALTKAFYQPVLHRLKIKPYALVDPDLARTRELATAWGAEITAPDPAEIADAVDAAIIASPNYLHASQAKIFLEKGKHVLLEKPMAVSEEEGRSLISMASGSGARLQIAMMRRFWKLNKAVKKMIEDNVLGRITDVNMQEGGVLSWPSQSLALFDKEKSLGGVLMDTGSHTLDLLYWWMQDTSDEPVYSDDNRGGVEADCDIRFRFNNFGTNVNITLTRIRNMPNEYKLTGEKGWIMIKPFGNLFETSASTISKMMFKYCTQSDLQTQTIQDVFEEQVSSWLSCIRFGTEPEVNAASVLPSIMLIEKCYSQRNDKIYPWEETD